MNSQIEKILGLLLLGAVIYILITMLFCKKSTNKKTFNNSTDIQEPVKLKHHFITSDSNTSNYNTPNSNGLNNNYEYIENFANSIENKLNALGMDERVSMPNTPFVKDACEQPAYFMPGESLIEYLNNDDERVKTIMNTIHSDGEESKRLMDNYANFRGETNQDSNGMAEDAVDRVNRLYRSGNESEARLFQGKKVKDVFNYFTGTNAEFKSDNCVSYTQDDQIYATV
jgi:hypothetical protein